MTASKWRLRTMCLNTFIKWNLKIVLCLSLFTRIKTWFRKNLFTGNIWYENEKLQIAQKFRRFLKNFEKLLRHSSSWMEWLTISIEIYALTLAMMCSKCFGLSIQMFGLVWFIAFSNFWFKSKPIQSNGHCQMIVPITHMYAVPVVVKITRMSDIYYGKKRVQRMREH